LNQANRSIDFIAVKSYGKIGTKYTISRGEKIISNTFINLKVGGVKTKEHSEKPEFSCITDYQEPFESGRSISERNGTYTDSYEMQE